MFCPVCGSDNIDGVKFCAGCGGEMPSEQNAITSMDMYQSQPMMGMQPYGAPQQMQQPYNNATMNNPYGGYQQPTPYGQQQFYIEPQKPKGTSIASMVCGIVGLCMVCFPFVGLATAIVGLILGLVSLGKKRGGKGMAIAGVVCSAVCILIWVIGVVWACSEGGGFSGITF